jgi:hypothetical protein
MALFKSATERAQSLYETSVRPHLRIKDGLIHCVMINSFSKIANQSFGIDEKYTMELNEILEAMQRDGYELVDFEFNSIQGQGLTGNREGFNTVIYYK